MDTESENMRKITLSKGQKFFIGITALLIVLLGAVTWQKSLATSIKKTYDAGYYFDAYKKCDSLFIKPFLSEYEDKVNVMSTIGMIYEVWEHGVKYGSGNRDVAWAVLYKYTERFASIEEHGCTKEADKIAKEVAQWLSDKGFGIESFLKDHYKEKAKSDLVILEGDDSIEKAIDHIVELISQ